MKLAIYNFFILIFIPIFVLRILFKSTADSDYRKFFFNRLGFSLERFPSSEKKIIWFHAVSLGEVIGSQGLIKKLSQNFDIVLTTSTPTGLKKAQAKKYAQSVLEHGEIKTAPLLYVPCVGNQKVMQ